jgi:hypothetical protein
LKPNIRKVYPTLLLAFGVLASCRGAPTQDSESAGLSATAVFHTTITGPSGTLTVAPNTDRELDGFRITNTSTATGTATLSCSPGPHITCLNFPDGNPVHLSPGQSYPFAVRFHAGTPIVKTFLTVTSNFGGSASGFIKIQ